MKKTALLKKIVLFVVIATVFVIPLNALAKSSQSIYGTVDFETYKLGYPQTSENGILTANGKATASSGKRSLRYGYSREVSEAKNGAFALLSFGGNKTITLKSATQYQIKFKYMLIGSAGCCVDLAFYSASPKTPISSKCRVEIGKIEKLIATKTPKNIWMEKTINVATDENFISFGNDSCNAFAIGFLAYDNAGMGVNTYLYLDDIEIIENGSAPKYTVRFETNGGSAVEDIKGLMNRPIVLPKKPTKVGKVFGGWYIDKNLTQKFSDSTFICNRTVYAKWLNDGSSYIDFEEEEYQSIYKVTDTTQTGISSERFFSVSHSLKAWNIINYGARRLLKTSDNKSIELKNHTLYRIDFDYLNYTGTPLYFSAFTSGEALYSGTQVFYDSFAFSVDNNWKSATYYFCTDLFSEQENKLALFFKGTNNNMTDLFIDNIAVTEIREVKDSVVMIIDHNDGEHCEYQIGKENEMFSTPQPKREGYRFIGWCEDIFGYNDFYDDAFYSNKIIYGKWAKLKQVQNFDDSYMYSGRSLGFDTDIEIYNSLSVNNTKANVISVANSIHRIGNKSLKKGFVIFDNTMEALVPDQNYLISFSVKADKISEPNGMIELAQTRAMAYSWSCDEEMTEVVPIGDLPKDSWVRVSCITTVYERYLALFTSGNNSLYFDDFSIEWVPSDAKLKGDKSVNIAVISNKSNTVNDADLIEKKSESDKVYNGLFPNTGDKICVSIICLALISLVSYTCCVVCLKGRRKRDERKADKSSQE